MAPVQVLLLRSWWRQANRHNGDARGRGNRRNRRLGYEGHRAMMRRLFTGLAVVAFASVALAQEPYGFGRQFALEESDRETEWRFNDRLVFLGRKLFFDARLSATGGTACARCHRPRYCFADS